MYYPMLNPMDLGIYSEISGMNVMKANAISKAAIQGSRAFAILWTGTSPILDVTNNTSPKGGERTPIIRLSTMIMPNWTKFTSNAINSGIRMGVRIVMAEVVSMNIPTTSRNILTMISSWVLLVTDWVTIPSIVWGISALTIHHAEQGCRCNQDANG